MSGFLDATYFVPNPVYTYMYQVYMPVIILNFLFQVCLHLFLVSSKVSGLKDEKQS